MGSTKNSVESPSSGCLQVRGAAANSVCYWLKGQGSSSKNEQKNSN